MSARRYGIFSVGDSLLALDIDCLREVVPCPALTIMPGRHPALQGCFNLRGVLVPVLDLRVLMSSGSESAGLHNVVIVATRNRLLGLLASDVRHVVECEAQKIGDSDAGHIIAGGFTLEGDDRPVSVIDAERLCDLPGIPSTGSRGEGGRTTADAEAEESGRHLMLMASGGVPLAIDATVVHTIILNPVIEDSPMKSGYCLGIIRYQNLRIPVIKLLGALGLEHVNAPPRQAFIIRYAEGFIAFTIEDIYDVVKLKRYRPLPVPEQSFKTPSCFTGVVPIEDMPPDTMAIQQCPQGQFLLIAHEHIQQKKSFIDIARMALPDKESQGDGLLAGHETGKGNTTQVLTIDVNGEVACPVVQVVQILPWSEKKMLLGLGCDQAGLVVSRDQAIPTYCLSALLGVPLSPISDTASILVIETEHGVIGFSVPRLITIDHGRLIPDADKVDHPLTGALYAQAIRGHVVIQSGTSSRLLAMLDLVKLAELCLAREQSTADLATTLLPDEICPPGAGLPQNSCPSL